MKETMLWIEINLAKWGLTHRIFLCGLGLLEALHRRTTAQGLVWTHQLLEYTDEEPSSRAASSANT